MEGAVLESIMQGLHVLLIVLGCRNVRPGDMRLRGDTAGSITRKRVSGHAAVDDTLARQTGDVSDTREGSAILADRRKRRQREHASAT